MRRFSRNSEEAPFRYFRQTNFLNGTLKGESNRPLIDRAKDFEAVGVKAMDSLHLACAESAGCDWFFTTDRGILNKAKTMTDMRVANPIEFVGGV